MASEATSVRHEPLDPSGAGAAIERWTLSAGPYEASVLTLGATLHTLTGPDRAGRPAQLLLSTDQLTQILGPARHYGTVVGRYANRIDGSRITIDGEEHPLAPTGGGITIHGGPDGFAQRIWEADGIEGGCGCGCTARTATRASPVRWTSPSPTPWTRPASW